MNPKFFIFIFICIFIFLPEDKGIRWTHGHITQTLPAGWVWRSTQTLTWVMVVHLLWRSWL